MEPQDVLLLGEMATQDVSLLDLVAQLVSS